MNLIQQNSDLSSYLETSEIIDFGYSVSREVTELSYHILTNSVDEIDFIKNAYEFVRDQIHHSADIEGRKITCKASEVLSAREGICYAKSHLLAALLRCNLIPVGFCYQQLILDDKSAPYLILHGLVAVYLEKYNKWIRLDARGNKPGIDAHFSIEDEKLAFPIRSELGEKDIPIIFPIPDKNVVSALTNSKDFSMLWSHLPRNLFHS